MRNTFMCCPLQGSWVNFDAVVSEKVHVIRTEESGLLVRESQNINM